MTTTMKEICAYIFLCAYLFGRENTADYKIKKINPHRLIISKGHVLLPILRRPQRGEI